ncbi:MAG: cyclic nucleotide-binding domain-containing protein [Gemmatimonadetes bacterium]|nr:cyclic nucleotide-binding domain-containing protein [Gemmatimonadota bacterium]
MNLVERRFALRGAPPFAQLYDSELAAVAEVATTRRLGAGAPLLKPGQPIRHLVVVADGALVDGDGREIPRVYGASSLLSGTPARGLVRAHPVHGATCLLISRLHFLTLASELPSVLIAMHEGQPRGPEGDP